MNDTGNIRTPVTAVSRHPNGRLVHLARTYDSFGTRSCDNRTTGPTREGRVCVASGIVEFQIASKVVFVVDTPRRSSPIYEHEVPREGKSGLQRKSAREKKEIYMQQEKEIRIDRDPGMDSNFPGDLIFFSSPSSQQEVRSN